MHQIEEILKQLNQQSAEIQPGTVQLLTRIQQRLMNRQSEQSEDVAADRPHPQRVASTAHAESQIPSEGDLRLQNEPQAAAVPSSQQELQPVADEELTPLLRSIMDSNRRLRGDLEQAIHQPRFMTVERNAEPVETLAESVVNWAESRSSGVATVDRSSANVVLSESTIEREGSAAGSAGSLRFPTGDLASAAGPSVSIRFPSDAVTPTPPLVAGANVAEPIVPEKGETKPPPVPHFEARPAREKPTFTSPVLTSAPAVTDESTCLPIFDSVWFRRNAPTREIGQIVDQILLKVPPVAPAILQLTQSIESQAQGHLVATQIAWELSRRSDGDVLLVDADFLMKEISRQLDNVYLPGLSDILNLDEAMTSVVRNTGVDHLFWLPSGQSDVSFRKTTPEQWSRLSAELKRRFAYICVYSGAAEDKVASTWGRFCDFTFLLTSLADDLGQPTQELVDQLRRADSRVAGLISIE